LIDVVVAVIKRRCGEMMVDAEICNEAIRIYQAIKDHPRFKDILEKIQQAADEVAIAFIIVAYKLSGYTVTKIWRSIRGRRLGEKRSVRVHKIVKLITEILGLQRLVDPEKIINRCLEEIKAPEDKIQSIKEHTHRILGLYRARDIATDVAAALSLALDLCNVYYTYHQIASCVRASIPTLIKARNNIISKLSRISSPAHSDQ